MTNVFWTIFAEYITGKWFLDYALCIRWGYLMSLLFKPINSLFFRKQIILWIDVAYVDLQILCSRIIIMLQIKTNLFQI